MKKLKILLGLAIAVTGITALGNNTEVHASNYTITKTKWYATNPIYHAKSATKSVYLWNKSHTKKLHNLKNYPNTNWYVSSSVIMRHNGKNALYFSVIASTPNKKPGVTGYVWHSYLSKGYNRHYSKWNNLTLSGFTSDLDYSNYIKKSSSQELTSDVLQLFPNSDLSLKLSHYVAFRDALRDEATTFNSQFSDKIVLTNVNQLFFHGYKDTRTEFQRLQAIEDALDKAGYDASKRASLKNYQIGIYYQNKVLVDHNDDMDVGLILAKSTN